MPTHCASVSILRHVHRLPTRGLSKTRAKHYCSISKLYEACLPGKGDVPCTPGIVCYITMCWPVLTCWIILKMWFLTTFLLVMWFKLHHVTSQDLRTCAMMTCRCLPTRTTRTRICFWLDWNLIELNCKDSTHTHTRSHLWTLLH